MGIFKLREKREGLKQDACHQRPAIPETTLVGRDFNRVVRKLADFSLDNPGNEDRFKSFAANAIVRHAEGIKSGNGNVLLARVIDEVVGDITARDQDLELNRQKTRDFISILDSHFPIRQSRGDESLSWGQYLADLAQDPERQTAVRNIAYSTTGSFIK